MEDLLSRHAHENALLLQPFARDTKLAWTAARTGKKAILIAEDELTAFCLRANLLPLSAHALEEALVRLADSRIGLATLSECFERSFHTICPLCKSDAVAAEVRFIGAAPTKVKPICRVCGLGGDTGDSLYDVTEVDRESADELDGFQAAGAYLAELIGDRLPDSESILSRSYSARNLNIIATIVGRLTHAAEAMNITSALRYCLLLAMRRSLAGDAEQGRSGDRMRVERNLWLEFTGAVKELAAVYEGRGAEEYPPRLSLALDRILDEEGYGRLGNPPNVAVITPNSDDLVRLSELRPVAFAYCELLPKADDACASIWPLWSCLILGQEGLLANGSEDKEAVWQLGESDYQFITRSMCDGAHMAIRLPGDDDHRLVRTSVASAAAGLQLQRLLRLVGDQDEYLLEYRLPAISLDLQAPEYISDQRQLMIETRLRVERSVRELLELRGEATEWPWLHAALVTSLAEDWLLAALLPLLDNDPERVSRFLDEELSELLEKGMRKGQLVRYASEAGDAWQLAAREQTSGALSDRIEVAVWQALAGGRPFRYEEVICLLSEQFYGLCSPDPQWVEACFNSYGRFFENGTYLLKDGEDAETRHCDHHEAVAVLTGLGHSLGLKVWIAKSMQRDECMGRPLGDLLSLNERFANPSLLMGGREAAEVDVIWYDGGSSAWIFEVEWMTAFTGAVSNRRLPGRGRRYLVLADERLPLLQYRLSRQPWLRSLLTVENWQVILWSALASAASSGLTDVRDVERLALSMEDLAQQGRGKEAVG